MTEPGGLPLAKLRIVLNQSFAGFGADARDRFLSGLAKVTGCPTSDMSNVTYRRGIGPSQDGGTPCQGFLGCQVSQPVDREGIWPA